MIDLTEKQRENLLKAYTRGKNGWGGLKTGWSLNRRGLVKLATIQLPNWTMWTITDKGIEFAEKFLKP